MGDVTATILDGKLTRDEIFVDLKARVSALAERGIVPGLGTILVGDDPGSRSYVRGKHNDCAKVGINSIRRDLPADVTQAELNAVIDELNANPDCTGYIVQLPLPKHLDENAALERIDPDKDADGLHPVNLGRLVLGKEATLPCTPAASCTCCAATTCRSTAGRASPTTRARGSPTIRYPQPSAPAQPSRPLSRRP